MTSTAESLPATLSSNGVAIPFDDEHFAPMRDSTALLADPPALRARFAEDGYVLLRGVLDRDEVLELRADYFARFGPALLAPGTTPRDGVFSGTLPDGLAAYGTAGHPAYDVVRGAAFDRLTRTPALQTVAEHLLDSPAQLLHRRILRHFHSGATTASRAHVDFDYLDRGSDRIVTAWMALGDYPIAAGGITYLEGSHRIPHDALDPLREHTDRPTDRRPVSNDLELTARVLGGRWMWTEFGAGDVALHSPHLVHASLDNRSDVMRLSGDVRFVRSGEQVDERWRADWSADDGY